MKKTILFILFAVIMIFSCSCAGNTKVKSPDYLSLKESAIKVKALSPEKNPAEQLPQDSVIIILLYPYIAEAVNNYFGEPTQWIRNDAKVNSITKMNSDYLYRISVTVPTFHGPHNPPYGLETMTFLIKSGEVVLENYIHKDVPS